MGLIAALLPAPVCRARLHAAVHGAHTVRECEDWVTLTRACETEPVHLAVFDLYSEGRPSFEQVRNATATLPTSRAALLRHAHARSGARRCSIWRGAGSTT